MSECYSETSAVHMEGCFCHQAFSEIRELVTVVCYYNCKICDYSCTSMVDIRHHVVGSHLQRTISDEGVVFSSELTTDGSAGSDHGSSMQMPSSVLSSTVATDELASSGTTVPVSKEFLTISQSGCDFLSSTIVTHSTHPSGLQPLQSTLADRTLQPFVDCQEVQLNVPNSFSADVDGMQQYVDSSHANTLVQPAELLQGFIFSSSAAVQSDVGQPADNRDQITEMYACDSCGTVFNGVGIVEHMMQIHGLHMDLVNTAESAHSACTSSSVEMTSMPPNTMSIGTQAQLVKKPGRKRKMITDVTATPAAIADEEQDRRRECTAEKDNAAAMAVKTLGIERITTADGCSGLSKRRIQPPRALVEDYHILRLRQSKPRTRSAGSVTAKLVCRFTGCTATFRQQEAVDYHIRCHMDSGQFCCPECSSYFAEWSSLLPHLLTVHGVSLYTYQCGRCQFRADNSSTVTRHNVAEHGCGKHTQTFLCSICGQTFKKASLRNQHEKSHSRRSLCRSRVQTELVAFRRCVCDVCKRSFANKKSLNKHIEVAFSAVLVLL